MKQMSWLNNCTGHFHFAVQKPLILKWNTFNWNENGNIILQSGAILYFFKLMKIYNAIIKMMKIWSFLFLFLVCIHCSANTGVWWPTIIIWGCGMVVVKQSLSQIFKVILDHHFNFKTYIILFSRIIRGMMWVMVYRIISVPQPWLPNIYYEEMNIKCKWVVSHNAYLYLTLPSPCR